MSGHAVAHLEEIDEMDDGRCPWRPAPLRPLYEGGEYAEAADRGRELAEAHPQYAELFYNVACCESLAGRTTDALESPPAFSPSSEVRTYSVWRPTTRTCFDLNRAWIPKALLVRRWQARQWHMEIRIGSPSAVR